MNRLADISQFESLCNRRPSLSNYEGKTRNFREDLDDLYKATKDRKFNLTQFYQDIIYDLDNVFLTRHKSKVIK